MLLIGTPRQPTLNVGSNGLGRHTYDFLKQFVKQPDLSITVMLHKDSKLEWDSVKVLPFHDEVREVEVIREHVIENKYDFVLDFTHWHLLSHRFANEELPIINFIHDEECNYMPPNCMLGNEWQRKRYTKGRVFTTGVDLDRYKLHDKKQEYLSFCGKLEYRKGYDIAYLIGKKSNNVVKFAGPDNDGRASELENWVGEINDHEELCKFVGNSKCLLYPSRSDAGGMGIWEAMAMGTPTITTNRSGAQYNVVHGKTGFVVSDIQDAVNSIAKLDTLSPEEVRSVCEDKWNLNKNFHKMYEQMINFVNGERW